MLNVPRLDDLSYQEIFERARGRISALTGEWTDLNYHDPGITTLSTFAWLTDTLNYYTNAAGEPHRLKYMKLLGLRPDCVAASCVLGMDCQGEYLLPRGIRLFAGDVPFEVAETAAGSANQLKALYNEVDARRWDLTGIAGVDGQFAQVFTTKKNVDAAVWFGFRQPLEGAVSFYVETSAPARRNPFNGSFSLSELGWEYYDGSRWQPARVLADETCGFLRDGTIALSLEGSTGEFSDDEILPAHYLRCSLKSNDYDLLPRLGRITVNCAKAVQTTTYARAIRMIYRGLGRMPVDWFVHEGDAVTVSVEDGDGYVQWYAGPDREDSLCDVEVGNYPWQRVIVFDEERFGEKPADGAELLVTITRPEAETAASVGVTSGCADEELELDADHVLELELALYDLSGDRPTLKLWKHVDDLMSAGYDDRVFAFDRARRRIMFGDGLHGLQPLPCQQVAAVTITTSAFEDGNVMEGKVNTLEADAKGVLSVRSLGCAAGGRYYQSSKELEPLIEEKILRTTRAVTADDYKTLVLNTPGLMIDCVNVIPMQEYASCYNLPAAHNTVVIAVKPFSTENNPVLSENYCRIIRSHLEKFRLLTTDIRIVPARYVQISVGGRIRLQERTPAARRAVEARIAEFLDGRSRGAFGQNVSLGKLFSALELMDCVSGIDQLTLEYIGTGGAKNQHGDVILFPDALACPGSIQLEFVNL